MLVLLIQEERDREMARVKQEGGIEEERVLVI